MEHRLQRTPFLHAEADRFRHARYVVGALILAGCGATRPHLETTRPWEVATQAVNHPPQLIDVVKPTLKYSPPSEASIPPQLREKVTLRSEAIDIRSLMLGLAKQTGLNITLDPDVAGQVSAYFTDVEVLTALRQIADQLGADVEVSGNVISVHRPRTEVRMFRMHYLRNTRAGMSQISVLDRATTSAPGGGVLGSGAGVSGTLPTAAGQITPPQAASGLPASTGNLSMIPRTSLNPGDSMNYMQSLFSSNFWEDLGIQLRAIIFEGDSEKDITSTNDHSAGVTMFDSAGRTLIIDSMSGTIVVKARRPILEEIGEYLKLVDLTVHRQVVIDVRILEVSLQDVTVFGIESQNFPLLASQAMNQLSQTVFGPGAGPETIQLLTSGYTTPLGFPQVQATTTTNAQISQQLIPSPAPEGFSIGGTYRAPNPAYLPGVIGTALAPNNTYVSSSFQLLMQMLGGLSDTRVVSSPRLTALHNQRAILKVVRDRVYFLFTPGSITPGTNGSPPIEIAPVPYPVIVPEGVIMDITPLIDDNGEVTLEIHPSFSVIIDTVTAPGNQGSEPEVERREFETTVHVKGEETVMLGGLVSETSTRTEQGIPYLKDIPYLGGLFRTTNDTTQKSEIIMLLTPRVQGPTVARDFVNGLRSLSDQDPIPVVAPPPEPTSGLQPAPAAGPTMSPPAAPKGP